MIRSKYLHVQRPANSPKECLGGYRCLHDKILFFPPKFGAFEIYVDGHHFGDNQIPNHSVLQIAPLFLPNLERTGLGYPPKRCRIDLWSRDWLWNHSVVRFTEERKRLRCVIIFSETLAACTDIISGFVCSVMKGMEQDPPKFTLGGPPPNDDWSNPKVVVIIGIVL